MNYNKYYSVNNLFTIREMTSQKEENERELIYIFNGSCFGNKRGITANIYFYLYLKAYK